MKLDIGTPNDEVTLANSRTVPARDDLGILLNAALYASRKCSTCYGRGMVMYTRPVTEDAAKAFIERNPKEESMISQKEPGKYTLNGSRWCGCAQRRYEKAHETFKQALLQACLAEVSGVRYDARGVRRDVIRLL